MLVLEGRDLILEQAGLLEQLAERCGQPAAMNWLAYFLNARGAKRKRRPSLILLLRPDADRHKLQAEHVCAAALFSEYRIFGWPSGIYTTEDSTGLRSVVAPLGEHAPAAALAVQVLLKRGAQLVMASFVGDAAGRDPRAPQLGRIKARWAQRTRVIGTHLRLAPTYRETMASLGKSTRFNLGYYRRRLLAKMPLEFVAEAANQVNDADIAGISVNPDDANELADFKLRLKSARTLPGSFLAGLRGADRTWLSLVGGWRQGTTTVLQWQMNSGKYKKDSLRAVMRSYFLEHEVQRGTERLIFYGGTSHSIQHSFQDECVVDLFVKRMSWRATLVERLLRLVASPRGVTRRINFLAEALRSGSLDWQTAGDSDDAADGAGSVEGPQRTHGIDATGERAPAYWEN